MAKHLLILTALLALSLSVDAALITRDLHTAGDGLITYDDFSGLEWLDLTETINRSRNEVASQLLPEGEFYGWSYASLDQVHQFFDNAGGNGEYRTTNNTVENAWVPAVVDVWGATYFDDTAFQSRFFTGDTWAPTSFNHVVVGHIGYSTINGTPLEDAYVSTLHAAASKDWADPYWGSALVRVAEVPIPSTMLLFASAILALLGSKRKRLI